MYKAFYSGNELLLLPVLSMFLFMVVFLIASVRAFRMRETEPMSALPLQDDVGPKGVRRE
jgi:hypothetical protein